MDFLDRVINDGYAIRIEVDTQFCDPVSAVILSRKGKEPMVLYRTRAKGVDAALEALEKLYESDDPIKRNN